MSIKHIEDLSVSDFIDVIESLNKYEATEKLDGANLSFGFDITTKKLFTSRESKQSSANRIFDAGEYPDIGSSNTFRSAHIALKSVEGKLSEAVKPGQLVEIEVLFGKQPNAITYGDGRSYIAFLRGIDGTSNEVVEALIQKFQNTTTTVKVPVISSPDGINLVTDEQDAIFEFVGPQKVNIDAVSNLYELTTLTKGLNDFLVEDASNLPSSVGKITNGDLAAINLTTVDTSDREDVKVQRELINAKIRRTYMLPIKQILISKLVHTKSQLSADTIADAEDIGIEGVVLRDPISGELVKIVDRNRFTALNAFNHVTRRIIGGQVKTTDPTAALESRGGIMGHMLIQVATLIGEPEMARSSQMRRIMDGYNTDGNPVTTIKAFADVHKPEDFQGFKRKITAVIKQAQADIAQALKIYESDKVNYKLQFSNGKSIGITDEVNNRTLLAFAEAKRDLDDLLEKAKASEQFAVLVAALYKRAVHRADDEAVEMIPESTRMLQERRYDTDVVRYTNKDSWTLLNIYFATVMLSAMMYKANDKLGLRMLKDKTNFRMERWAKEMSPLNFWGYPIWRSNTPAVRKLIGTKNAKELNKVTRRVPPAWFRFLHMDLSFGYDVPINWVDHYKTMKVLQQYPGMNVERINIILKGVFSYENLTYDQKIKVMNSLFYYVQQFIPYSPLFIRFKAIYHELLNTRPEDNSMIIAEILNAPNIKETADGGAVTGADTNVLPNSLLGGKSKANVIKRKRNKDIKFLKFVKPEDCPIK